MKFLVTTTKRIKVGMWVPSTEDFRLNEHFFCFNVHGIPFTDIKNPDFSQEKKIQFFVSLLLQVRDV